MRAIATRSWQSCAIGMHPEAGQFDELTGPEPVTRSCHGHELADHKITEHFGTGFIVEAQRH
jgi:hypothetical protein